MDAKLKQYCINCEHRVFNWNQSGIGAYRCIVKGKLTDKGRIDIPNRCRSYESKEVR
jgi:hypothetical protein